MKTMAGGALATVVWMFSQSALATDWTVTVAPTLDYAFKSTTFSTLVDGETVDLIKPRFTTMVPSLAVSMGRFYGAVSYEFTVNDWKDETLAIGATSTSLTLTQYERTETSFTVGARVFDGAGKVGPISVFAGYLVGDSTWVSTGYIRDTAPLSYAFDVERITFNEEGFYLGASYSHSFDRRGTLSFSTAYGFLDSINKFVSISTDKDIFSDGNGYSLAMTWTGSLSDTMSYRVIAKYVDYTFDVDSEQNKLTGNVTNFTKGQLEFGESITTFQVGVTKYF